MLNDDEPCVGEGVGVGSAKANDQVALAELRNALRAGQIKRGMTVTQLARAAGLSRTTVSQALSTNENAAPPSAATLVALAPALRLDGPALVRLLDAAMAQGPPVPAADVLGMPVLECDPYDLEVHPAAGPEDQSHQWNARAATLPGYVRRQHDVILGAVIAAAAAGHSGMAVLVGSSSTGKTRACWEAVQPLASMGWRLWHPYDPTRAEAAEEALAQVTPRTVVWLNEAQHYFGAVNGVGERIAAGVHRLLTGLNGAPVLVLGTLWPEYAQAYSALPTAGQDDHYPRVRELLAGRLIPLPDSFDHSAAEQAQRLASQGDRYLAHALEHAGDGRLTQFLAGAPELLRRYHTLSPAARALLRAAMDARRLGGGLHLPGVFLEGAAPDYLTDDEFDDLAENWMETALADATQSVHGNLAPLRRVRHRKDRHRTAVASSVRQAPVYRLADYLEQHGRRERRLLCPPESFWVRLFWSEPAGQARSS